MKDYIYLKQKIEEKISYEFDSVIMKELKIDKELYYEIVKRYNIQKYSKTEKLFNKALRTISKETLYDFYITENHNLYQVRDHFNIGWDLMIKLLDYYKIKKDWDNIIATRKQNNLLKNGSENYVNVESRKLTIQNYSEEVKLAIKEKRKQTCYQKFGAESNLSLPEVRKQIEETCLSKYGVKNYSQTQEWFNKAVSSYKKHYGIDWYSKSLEYQIIANNTKRKNKSSTKSKPEDIFEQDLLKLFKQEDIVRQYTDSRYVNPINQHPFNCDFYIRSLDLFIELNLYWTHGPHPFNCNNPEDIKLLEIIKSKQKYRINHKQQLVKNLYFQYEENWTIRDNIKINIAAMNNLNYIVLYNFDELNMCLEMLKNLRH